MTMTPRWHPAREIINKTGPMNRLRRRRSTLKLVPDRVQTTQSPDRQTTRSRFQ